MVPKINVSHKHGGHEQQTPPESEPTGFDVFGLSPKLLRAIDDLGWTTPTPVQLKAIPPALEGHDVVGLAQTGTGKTGAFLLPLIETLSTMPQAKPRSPYCVILVPTRELVQQIDAQVKALSRGTRLRSMAIFGGVSEKPQIAALRKGVEIVAATPGRLLDLMGQGVIHFNKVEHCVLDEADRMFDMGFINDMKRILSPMPATKQTLLFSATMPPEIQRLTQEFLHQPRELRMSATLPPAELVHEVWELTVPQKISALEFLLSQKDEGMPKHESVLIFTRTKHRANSLSRRLDRAGQDVVVLHGNRSQNQRDIALRRFKEGRARVMVATDVASRGLDIMGISLVINFDTPQDPGDYVHRVGRTARAKRDGFAVTFAVPEENKYIRGIEQLLKQRLVRRRQSSNNNNFIPSTADNPAADERREPSSERRRDRPEPRYKGSSDRDRPRHKGGSDRDRPQRDGSLDRDRPRRDSSSDRDRPRRDGSSDRDRPRRDGSSDRDRPRRDSSSDRDRPRRDSSSDRDRPRRDSSSDRDRPRRDSSSDRDRPRRDSSSDRDRPRRDDEQPRFEGERSNREGERRRPARPGKPRKQRNRRQGSSGSQSQPGSGSRSGRQSNPRQGRKDQERKNDERSVRRSEQTSGDDRPSRDRRPDSRSEERSARGGRSEPRSDGPSSGPRNWRDKPPASSNNPRRGRG